MKIVNTAAFPRVISYANGRNMGSGDWSPELKLDTIFNHLFWKDVDNRMAAYRLSDADQAFVTKLLTQNEEPVVVQQLPSKTVPHSAQPRKEAAASLSASPVPAPLPRTTPVPPQAPSMAPTGVLPLPAGSVRPSLADLKRMNDVGTVKAQRLTDIGTFMGSKV